MPRAPMTIALPPSLSDEGFFFDRALARALDVPWSQAWTMRPAFLLSRPEQAFARAFLERLRNWKLYRCNQRRACGDFLAVNMSSPVPGLRPTYAIELKQGQPVQVGGGTAGLQLRNAELAFAELAARAAVITAQSPLRRVSGGGPEVLAWLASGATLVD